MNNPNIFPDGLIPDVKPFYFGKTLLLSNRFKDSLFRTNSSSRIEFTFDMAGKLSIQIVSASTKREKIDIPFSEVGKEYLDNCNISSKEILGYLVLPEMEIERIFNSLRYNYLMSIYKSGCELSKEFSNYRAFQALANLKVYQGNTKERKDNDYWLPVGLKRTPEESDNFKAEKTNLDFILKYLRTRKYDNFNKIYAELIAIKPGFHEIQVHSKYFEEIPRGKGIRDQVFRSLRGLACLEDMKLDDLPREINRLSYLKYASCNITEGPFVFRKDLSISYFDELSKIKTAKEINNLEEKFFILNYKYDNIKNKEALRELLNRAKIFKYYMI